MYGLYGGDTGNEDRTTAMSGFLNLKIYAVFSFDMTNSLASDCGKFKSIITQIFEDMRQKFILILASLFWRH